MNKITPNKPRARRVVVVTNHIRLQCPFDGMDECNSYLHEPFHQTVMESKIDY